MRSCVPEHDEFPFARIALLALIASGVLQNHAAADVITFNDRAAWESAVGPSITNIDFEELAPAGGSASFPNLELSGVHFGPAVVQDPGVGSYISAWGTGAMLIRFDVFNTMTTSFVSPVTAFGFSFGASACILVGPCGSASGPPQGEARLLLSSGESMVTSGPMPPLRFIGVVSSVPLTSFSMTISPTFPVIDNFAVGPPVQHTPVPEPASLALLGTGLLGALARRRRRQPRTSSSHLSAG